MSDPRGLEFVSFLFAGTLPKSKTSNSTWCTQGLNSNLPKTEWRLESPSENRIGAQAPSLCLQLPGPYVLHWLEAAGGRVWDR